MQTSRKVIFNSIILYAKVIITLLLSLVSMPIILRALGESDYGLYNLIAGIITMLAFLNASMAVSTQRFLSVAIGEGNEHHLNVIYNCAIVLHLLIGGIVVVLFEICYFFLFDSFLSIEPDRVATAKRIYQFLVISTFFTVLSVPYSAVMNAKEDMLAFSVIDILDAVLKLVLALYLTICPYDRLLVYGLLMATIAVMNTLINRFYVRIKYPDFRLNIKCFFEKKTFHDLFAFAGWNTLGSLSVVGKNQGVAIVFNVFCGTVANAAYGIANQISGILSNFSSTFQKALNPQLMKSEGMKNRERLIRISMMSSKVSVLVLAFFAIPLVLEMHYVLLIWLKDIPEHTLRLSQFVIINAIVFQYSVGLMSGIQATGKIRDYFMIISILYIINIPLSYLLLKEGFPLHFCIIGFISIELIALIFRIGLCKKIIGLNPMLFLKDVVFPTMGCILLSLAFSLPFHLFMKESMMRVVVVTISYLLVFCCTSWLFALDSSQKTIVIDFTSFLRCKH